MSGELKCLKGKGLELKQCSVKVPNAKGWREGTVESAVTQAWYQGKTRGAGVVTGTHGANKEGAGPVNTSFSPSSLPLMC